MRERPDGTWLVYLETLAPDQPLVDRVIQSPNGMVSTLFGTIPVHDPIPATIKTKGSK